MKYMITFKDDDLDLVTEFRDITKRNGFKQNALVLEYMKYVVSRLKKRENMLDETTIKLTDMDVFFNKERITVSLLNE